MSRLLLFAAMAVAAAASGDPRVAADVSYAPYLVSSEGPVDRPRIDVAFPPDAAPRRARVVLVESDLPPDQARVHRVRRVRRASA